MRVMLLLAAAFVAGCSFEIAGRMEAPPARACSDTARHCDTSRGEVCRRPDGTGAPIAATDGGSEAFNGICVIVGTQATGDVFLEVRPTDATIPTSQVGPISLARGSNQDVVVPAPVSVNGAVRDTTQAAVERARVRFRSNGLIAGRPLVFDTESGGDDAPGIFARLLPQGSYSVTVQPRDRNELRPPPERPLGDAATSLNESTQRLDLEVSHPSDLIAVSGRVMLAGLDTNTPATGVEVWAMAVDDESILPIRPTGRAVAQPARTDGDGRFTFWLPRIPTGEKGHRIWLSVSPLVDGPLLPTFRFAEILEITESRELATPLLLAGAGGPLAPVEVTGRVVNPDGSAGVGSARLSFRTVDDAPFAFATTVTTDAGGRFAARLFPAKYRASALPAPSFDGTAGLGACGLTDAVDLTRDTPDLTIRCAPRHFVFGQVIDAQGVPVANVQVEAVRQPDAAVGEELRDQALTDGNGNFRIGLAAGKHDIVLQPPPGAGPFKTLRGLKVASEASDDLLVLQLDAPFDLFGRLFSGDVGKGLAGSIEAYSVLPDGTTVLVGRGLAQGDGSFAITLPAGK